MVCAPAQTCASDSALISGGPRVVRACASSCRCTGASRGARCCPSREPFRLQPAPHECRTPPAMVTAQNCMCQRLMIPLFFLNGQHSESGWALGGSMGLPGGKLRQWSSLDVRVVPSVGRSRAAGVASVRGAGGGGGARGRGGSAALGLPAGAGPRAPPRPLVHPVGVVRPLGRPGTGTRVRGGGGGSSWWPKHRTGARAPPPPAPPRRSVTSPPPDRHRPPPSYRPPLSLASTPAQGTRPPLLLSFSARVCLGGGGGGRRLEGVFKRGGPGGVTLSSTAPRLHSPISRPPPRSKRRTRVTAPTRFVKGRREAALPWGY